MLEIERLDIGPAAFIIAAAIIVLTVQLVLLVKVRNWFIRLIPIFVSFAIITLFSVLFFASPGWDRVGCLLFATFSAYILILDLLTVALWGIIRLVKEKKQAR